MSEINYSEIVGLEVNKGKRLSVEIKTRLSKIISEIFGKKGCVAATQYEVRKQAATEKARLRFGARELVILYERVEKELKSLDERLAALGFDVKGNLRTWYGYGSNSNEAADKGRKKVEAFIEAEVGPVPNLEEEESKVITKLMLADTYGDALKIMRAVLNGTDGLLSK